MSLKYRYKDLKTYTSTELFEGNTKHYRTIYEKQETPYAYCELSFFNKQFDQ
jgi:hypothetical protein